MKPYRPYNSEGLVMDDIQKNTVEDVTKAIDFFNGQEVKMVFKEDGRVKVGTGKIVAQDDTHVFLEGTRGRIMARKKDIMTIKQSNRNV